MCVSVCEGGSFVDQGLPKDSELTRDTGLCLIYQSRWLFRLIGDVQSGHIEARSVGGVSGSSVLVNEGLTLTLLTP